VAPTIFTVGHSTRPIAAFVALLQSVSVAELWDTRTVPKSRANPQFARDALEQSLPAAGIAYRHEPRLGGLRKPRKDSPNKAWQNESFRGYADHMQTADFAAALRDLIDAGTKARVAVMCAEGNPFRCHRRLIADALLAHGVPSAELSAPGRAKPHRLTEFARVLDGRVTYPAPQ
jgi:uncharacterized protein (DUF488 family)